MSFTVLFRQLNDSIYHYSPFWNFEHVTNVIIWERRPSNLPPPHPEVEILRSQLMSKLRQLFAELCQSREGKYTQICNCSRNYLQYYMILNHYLRSFDDTFSS